MYTQNIGVDCVGIGSNITGGFHHVLLVVLLPAPSSASKKLETVSLSVRIHTKSSASGGGLSGNMGFGALASSATTTN